MTNGPETTETTQIIQQQWQAWDGIVGARGEIDEGANPPLLEYSCAIDRRLEEESQISVDRVEVTKLSNRTLEQWMGTTSVRAQPEEQWLEIKFHPDDPYHLTLGIYPAAVGGQSHDNYYVRGGTVYLSNQGRSFEQPSWGLCFPPALPPAQPTPTILYLKQSPDPKQIPFTFSQDPTATKDLQPLNGHTLERLAILLAKVKAGETLGRHLN